MATELQTSLTSTELLASATVGAVTFPSVLALAQTAIFKPLRITCAGRLAPLFGCLSISLAGFAASFTAIKACSLIQDSLRDTNHEETGSKKLSFSAPELMISTVSSVVIFRALGGRFSSVLPSHLFHPGAFAVERLPAVRGYQMANGTEKTLIRDYGWRYGCHSCGKKQVKTFVCDHQPPSHLLRKSNPSSTVAATTESSGNGVKVSMDSSNSAGGIENGVTIKQYFYPQCFNCSSMQGGMLNSGNPSKAIIVHPFSLRLYHVFLPVPFVISHLKSSLQEGIAASTITKLATTSGDTAVKNFSSKMAQVPQDKVEKATQTPKGFVSVASSNKNSLRSFIQDSDISELVSNFPLLIVWKRAVQFLDSFKNPGDGFHIMLWAFVIVAAWGTV